MNYTCMDNAVLREFWKNSNPTFTLMLKLETLAFHELTVRAYSCQAWVGIIRNSSSRSTLLLGRGVWSIFALFSDIAAYHWRAASWRSNYSWNISRPTAPHQRSMNLGRRTSLSIWDFWNCSPANCRSLVCGGHCRSRKRSIRRIRKRSSLCSSCHSFTLMKLIPIRRGKTFS